MRDNPNESKLHHFSPKIFDCVKQKQKRIFNGKNVFR